MTSGRPARNGRINVRPWEAGSKFVPYDGLHPGGSVLSVMTDSEIKCRHVDRSAQAVFAKAFRRA